MSANPVVRPQNSDLNETAPGLAGAVRVAVTKPFPPAHAHVVETLERIAAEPAATYTSTQHVSRWCMSPFKRLFDLACVIPALILLSPVLLVVAILVWLTSEGPVFFRQERLGLHRRIFTVYKFRTMFHERACAGPCITKMGDKRLTTFGKMLRKYKLDELPQLYNVLRGDMSLVGPRPKLPQLEHLEMQYRPGVTVTATMAFASEEEMLREIPDAMLEEFHLNVLSPIKKELDRKYHEQATLGSDLRILVNTVLRRQPPIDLSGHLGVLWAEVLSAQKSQSRCEPVEHAQSHGESLVSVLAAEQAGD